MIWANIWILRTPSDRRTVGQLLLQPDNKRVEVLEQRLAVQLRLGIIRDHLHRFWPWHATAQGEGCTRETRTRVRQHGVEDRKRSEEFWRTYQVEGQAWNSNFGFKFVLDLPAPGCPVFRASEFSARNLHNIQTLKAGHLLQTLSGRFAVVDVALVQAAFVAGRLTEVLMELELKKMRDEVSNVGNAGGHL